MSEEFAPLLLVFGVLLALIITVTVKLALERREVSAQQQDPDSEIKTPTRFIQRTKEPIRQASQRTAKVVTKDDPAARRR